MAVTETELDDTRTLALAKLPRDLAIIKMENDSMMALAAANPIDHDAALADVKAQLKAYKSFAQSAMYNKPVGRDPVTGVMKIARNLSIRSAEALACAYGFNKVRCDFVQVDEDTVRVEACYTSFRDGRIWQSSGLVCKTYKTRQGQTRRWADDRFNNVVLKAEASRQIRECIIRAMPPGLRAELAITIDEQQDVFLDDTTVQKIIAQFSTKGVTQEQLEQQIGKRIANFNKEDRRILVGFWTAVEEGETTIAEIFGAQPTPAEQPKGSRTDAVADKLNSAKEPNPETQATVREQVEQVRATNEAHLAEKRARRAAEARKAVESEAAAQVSPPLSDTQAAAEATAEHVLPDEPPPETETRTGGQRMVTNYEGKYAADESNLVGFCPIKELKDLKTGAVIQTAGRIAKRNSRKVVRKGQAVTTTDVFLYDAACNFRLTWEGQVPDWAHIDAAVEVTRAEVVRMYKETPQIYIREWQPATEPKEDSQ